MSSLKEKLATAPDVRTKDVQLDGRFTVCIRRLTVRERDEWLATVPSENGAKDIAKGSRSSLTLCHIGTEPHESLDDLQDMPAAIVEELAMKIMEWNGWTAAGRARLEDQFRPPAGSAV